MQAPVDLQLIGSEVAIRWAEGAESFISFATLRANSPSAAVRGERDIFGHQYGGEVPPSFEILESLPGVGHKTASVVMSQAFGIPAFPVDTHIFRLAARWGLSDGKNVVKTERDLKAVFSEKDWNKLHLQFIYFGREYCPARGHHPEKCPICSIYGV